MKLTDHPRAKHHIRLAKGWGGLIGFAVVGYLSWRAHVPWFQLGLRALAGGIAAHLAAWGAAVHVWRHLAIAEIRHHHRRGHGPPARKPEANPAPDPAGAS